MSFNTNRPIFDQDPFFKDINDNYVKKDSETIKAPTVKENNWIKTETTKISLVKVIDQSFYEGHIVLQNEIDKYIVFKFKSEKNCYVWHEHLARWMLYAHGYGGNQHDSTRP